MPQFLAKRTFSCCCHFTYKSSIFIPILTHLVLCVRRNIFGHCVQAHTILQHLPLSFFLSLSLMNGVIHQLQINHHEKIIKGNQSQSRIPPSLDSSPDRLRVISYLPIFCPHRARDKLSLAQVENHPIFTTEKTT